MTWSEMSAKGRKLAPLIDHTLLKPDAGKEQVKNLCREAIHYGFAAVCVSPSMVKTAAKELEGSSVKPGTVIGFPMGYMTTKIKGYEVMDALKNGAQELDMVLAVSALKDGDMKYVVNDIRTVVERAEGKTVKVILETCLLTDSEKETACKLAVEAGAHFVKTSTGLAGGGATEPDIRLMRKIVGPGFGVKASGGIKTLSDAMKMVAAGANRIGTSSGSAIVCDQG